MRDPQHGFHPRALRQICQSSAIKIILISAKTNARDMGYSREHSQTGNNSPVFSWPMQTLFDIIANRLHFG